MWLYNTKKNRNILRIGCPYNVFTFITQKPYLIFQFNFNFGKLGVFPPQMSCFTTKHFAIQCYHACTSTQHVPLSHTLLHNTTQHHAVLYSMTQDRATKHNSTNATCQHRKDNCNTIYIANFRTGACFLRIMWTAEQDGNARYEAIGSDIRRQQAISGDSKRYQAIGSDIRRQQAISGDSKRYQAIGSDIRRWQCEPH